MRKTQEISAKNHNKINIGATKYRTNPAPYIDKGSNDIALHKLKFEKNKKN